MSLSNIENHITKKNIHSIKLKKYKIYMSKHVTIFVCAILYLIIITKFPMNQFKFSSKTIYQSGSLKYKSNIINIEYYLIVLEANYMVTICIHFVADNNNT